MNHDSGNAHINVLLFGRLGEIAGRESMVLESVPNQSCESIRSVLKTKLPSLSSELDRPRTMVAINKTLSQWDTEVTSGDEVAILPPVTGG